MKTEVSGSSRILAVFTLLSLKSPPLWPGGRRGGVDHKDVVFTDPLLV